MGLDIERANSAVMDGLVPRIPMRTGQLQGHIFDNGEFAYDNTVGTDLLKNPLVYYGFILNNSPTIRRAIRRNGHKYDYKISVNKHFRFLDRYFEDEAIRIFEQELGVKRI